jgi:aerobic-type carbon monoxide dehydrogenase small subunit (CoxS/CutS family)
MSELLHEKLGWLGVKDMCYGIGACGSCTIIVDGRPVLACLTLAIECNGAVVETSEGAARANPNLLESYARNSCPQCGYCTPGFFVTSKALLDRIPRPSEAEIREALGGNICR